jgi:hypothetical protein
MHPQTKNIKYPLAEKALFLKKKEKKVIETVFPGRGVDPEFKA